MKRFSSILGIEFVMLVAILAFQSTEPEAFKKTKITSDFISEGVAAGDLNKDGKIDIVAGYYWFEAPNWTKHEMAPSRTFDPRKEYSESFLNLCLDVNLDGWMDVVIVDFPGKAGFWFENPKNKSGQWEKHIIADGMGISNESPGFIDVDQDGRLDILCGDKDKKQIVWLQAPTKKGETAWKRHALSQEKVPGTESFSHGIGMGDINMDGIADVVIREGWFEGKKNLSSGDWTFHPTNLGEACSHMQVMDINGDGRNDVLSASAHALGVWWHEQVVNQGEISFKTHLMSTRTAQTHASILVDLNGDGKKEYLTGKRFLAHHGRDAGDSDPAMLFYFDFNEKDKNQLWKEQLIDQDSGAGLNITVMDVNQDKKPDIIISNKNGVFLFENQIKKRR